MEMVKLVKELFILRWRKEVVTNNLLLQKPVIPPHEKNNRLQTIKSPLLPIPFPDNTDQG